MTRRVGVVGLGLIGGSVAAGLRRDGAVVRGFDRSPARTRRAATLGLIDEPCETLAAAVAGADAVIVAAPVGTIVDLLPAIDAAAPPDALLLDVGSVKGPVVTAMAALPGAHRAVGGHPLAGAERSGPDSADAALLWGRNFVLCPSPRTSPSALGQAREIVRMIGMDPVELPAEEHDRILARTSHLPQFLATALALSLAPGDPALAGPALRDMTRLTASDPVVWRDIARANRDNIVGALRGCMASIERLCALIEADDVAGLETAMVTAARAARMTSSREAV